MVSGLLTIQTVALLETTTGEEVLLRAVRAGSATISVESGGQRGTRAVTVLPSLVIDGTLYVDADIVTSSDPTTFRNARLVRGGPDNKRRHQQQQQLRVPLPGRVHRPGQIYPTVLVHGNDKRFGKRNIRLAISLLPSDRLGHRLQLRGSDGIPSLGSGRSKARVILTWK